MYSCVPPPLLPSLPYWPPLPRLVCIIEFLLFSLLFLTDLLLHVSSVFLRSWKSDRRRVLLMSSRSTWCSLLVSPLGPIIGAFPFRHLVSFLCRRVIKMVPSDEVRAKAHASLCTCVYLYLTRRLLKQCLLVSSETRCNKLSNEQVSCLTNN